MTYGGTIGELHAAHHAIVGTEEDKIADDDGSEAHGAVRKRPPDFRAGVGVEGDQAILPRAANDELFPGHNRLVAAIKLKACLFVGRTQ